MRKFIATATLGADSQRSGLNSSRRAHLADLKASSTYDNAEGTGRGEKQTH
jgi:hypothetical protein